MRGAHMKAMFGAVLVLLSTVRAEAAMTTYSRTKVPTQDLETALATMVEKKEQADFQVLKNERDAKLFSVFQIIQFKNGMCNATDGNMGVCFTTAECTSKGGVSTGSCASGFGVCCVFKVNTCGGQVSQLVSYIESPNYPQTAPAGMCMFTLPKCDSSICQFKVQYEDVMLANPSAGTCSNDTLIFSGLDAVSTNTVPNPVCGTLTGQSMIFSVNETTSIPKFTFNVGSTASMSRWRIKVTQIPCSDSRIAPPGCITYNQGTSGTFTSYNNQNGNGQSITSSNCYSHCIQHQPGFCNVAFTANDFDLATGDKIAIGTSIFSGTTFGTANSVIYNFTGPYTFPVCLQNPNTGTNSGYNINYLLLPC